MVIYRGHAGTRFSGPTRLHGCLDTVSHRHRVQYPFWQRLNTGQSIQDFIGELLASEEYEANILPQGLDKVIFDINKEPASPNFHRIDVRRDL